MEVAKGGRDVAVPQQALHGVEIGPGFEEMRSEGVAERVNAALLLDAGAELRHHVDLLRDGYVDGPGPLPIGEQPHAWRVRLPVRADPGASAWRAGRSGPSRLSPGRCERSCD